MHALLIMMVIIRSKGVVLEGFAQGGFLWIGIGKMLYVFGFVPLESNDQEKAQNIFFRYPDSKAEELTGDIANITNDYNV